MITILFENNPIVVQGGTNGPQVLLLWDPEIGFTIRDTDSSVTFSIGTTVING